MLKLSIRDRRALVSEAELAAAIQEGIPALQRAQTGEEQYADSLGWLHVDEWAGEDVLARIEQVAAHVRETCDAFVLIGVGGSNNAARSVIEALADGTGPQIIYAGNTLSAHAMNRMLKQLEGKRFAVDCIAKNFETLEPGVSFRVLRRELAARCTPAEAAGRIICTGTIGSPLEQLCTDEGYTCLPFPTNIGGRYHGHELRGASAHGGGGHRHPRPGARRRRHGSRPARRRAGGQPGPAVRGAAQPVLSARLQAGAACQL